MHAEREITAVQRVGGVLQRIPAAHKTAVLALQISGVTRRARQLNGYLGQVPPQRRKLSLGSGAMTQDGWMSTDLVPVKRSVMYLDATKRWPIPSGSFQYVLCEHMLEQVPYDAGLEVLREAHRILRPGGTLRISTPNLDVIRLLPDSRDPRVEEYVEWSNRTFGSPAEMADAGSAVHALNRVMRAWGHTYIYDEATLRHALNLTEFHQIVRCTPGESAHVELLGTDRHAQLVGETPNRVESLILEATA